MTWKLSHMLLHNEWVNNDIKNSKHALKQMKRRTQQSKVCGAPGQQSYQGHSQHYRPIKKENKTTPPKTKKQKTEKAEVNNLTLLQKKLKNNEAKSEYMEGNNKDQSRNKGNTILKNKIPKKKKK